VAVRSWKQRQWEASSGACSGQEVGAVEHAVEVGAVVHAVEVGAVVHAVEMGAVEHAVEVGQWTSIACSAG
jgi:hypothetical protein